MIMVTLHIPRLSPPTYFLRKEIQYCTNMYQHIEFISSLLRVPPCNVANNVCYFFELVERDVCEWVYWCLCFIANLNTEKQKNIVPVPEVV